MGLFQLALLTGSGALLALTSDAAAQGRAGSESEEDGLFKRAEEHFNAGDYGKAADLYDEVIKLNPNRVEAFVKRATLYFRERQFEKAIDLLSRAEKQSVTDLNVKTVLGLCFYETGKKERGLSYLEDVVKQRPESYDAQFQLGKHYARIQPERAITALEQYFRVRPDDQAALDPLAHLHLGTALFLKGDLAEAVKHLTVAKEARSKDNQIRLMLATALMAQKKWQPAADLFEPFRADVDRRPAVAFNLATCYLNLGRRDEAKTLIQKYLALKPNDPRGLLLLGHIERASDKDAEVRGALLRYQQAQEAQKSAPVEGRTHASISGAIARTHLQLKDTSKAVTSLEGALTDARTRDDDGGREEAELTGLMIESRLQQMALAKIAPGSAQAPSGLIPLAERLVELAPSDAGALALAGAAAYAAGVFDKAKQYFTEARGIDEKLPRARIGLSRTLEHLAISSLDSVEDREPGRAEKSARKEAAAQEQRMSALAAAQGMLREAQRLDDNPGVNRNLAAVYMMQGNAAEAERILAALLVGKPDVMALRMRARVALLQGKPAEAQAALEKAVAEAKRIADAGGGDLGKRAAQARLAEAQLELASRLLGSEKDTKDRLDRAVEVLDQVAKDLAGSDNKEILRVAQRNLAMAHLRRGKLRLQEVEGQIVRSGVTQAGTRLAEDALEDIQAALSSQQLDAQNKEIGHANCLGALAAAQANQGKAARELLNKAASAGCELVPPYSKAGLDLLGAFITYRTTTAAAQREALLKTLPKLQTKAGTGADGAALTRAIRTMLYATNMALAYDYYVSGRPKLVAPVLRAAQKSQVRLGDDDEAILEHNLAVIEVGEGKATGERTLDRLGMRPPETQVNLGILADRRGQPRKALEYYRKALEKGARAPRLKEWIDTKERLLGTGGQGGQP